MRSQAAIRARPSTGRCEAETAKPSSDRFDRERPRSGHDAAIAKLDHYPLPAPVDTAAPGDVPSIAVGSSPRRRRPARGAKPARHALHPDTLIPRARSEVGDHRHRVPIGTPGEQAMSRSILPFHSNDISSLARSLKSQLAEHGSEPS